MERSRVTYLSIEASRTLQARYDQTRQRVTDLEHTLAELLPFIDRMILAAPTPAMRNNAQEHLDTINAALAQYL